MPKKVYLQQVPDDVMDIIYEKQLELRKKHKRLISIEKTICRIVREFKIRESENAKA